MSLPWRQVDLHKSNQAVKLGHSKNQIRPLRVKQGRTQFSVLAEIGHSLDQIKTGPPWNWAR